MGPPESACGSVNQSMDIAPEIPLEHMTPGPVILHQPHIPVNIPKFPNMDNIKRETPKLRDEPDFDDGRSDNRNSS